MHGSIKDNIAIHGLELGIEVEKVINFEHSSGCEIILITSTST